MAGEAPYEFELHAIAGLRLLNAVDRHVQQISKQLGLEPTRLGRDPDIVIDYQKPAPTSDPVNFLGLSDAGFDQSSFFMLRERGAQVRYELADIGGTIRIYADPRVVRIPLLVPMINFTMLSKGFLPVHASAFSYQGVGVLVPGWAKGGKTETLLAFLRHGGRYIGDEWIYLDPQSGRMFGIPLPITFWDWHLSYIPMYRQYMQRSDKMRLHVSKLLVRSARGLRPRKFLTNTTFDRILRWIESSFNSFLYLQLSPQEVFAGQFDDLTGHMDRILLPISWDQDRTSLERADPLTIAERMRFSLQHERLFFQSQYWKYRFAFPDRGNSWLEKVCALEREMLLKAFSNTEAYVLRHPYPMDIDQLFDHASTCIHDGQVQT